MPNIIDLTGQQFGFLKVNCRSQHRGRQAGAFWECECICGRTVSIHGGSLRKGKSESCGCRGNNVLDIGEMKKSSIQRTPRRDPSEMKCGQKIKVCYNSSKCYHAPYCIAAKNVEPK